MAEFETPNEKSSHWDAIPSVSQSAGGAIATGAALAIYSTFGFDLGVVALLVVISAGVWAE